MIASPPCPVHVVGRRIVDRAGATVYRDPARKALSAELKCSGRTVWVVFHGGVASSQEAYVGVRSGNGGRTWRVVFAERYFGVKAPHELDSYAGPWTLAGPRVAYFTGSCPACDGWTDSLWVTRDGGRSFRRYRLPALTGYVPTAIRAAGDRVVVRARRMVRGRPPVRSVAVDVGRT